MAEDEDEENNRNMKLPNNEFRQLNKHSLRINPRLKFGSLANQATRPRIIGRRLQNGWCAESATTCVGYLCVKAKEPLEVIRDFSKLLQAGS